MSSNQKKIQKQKLPNQNRKTRHALNPLKNRATGIENEKADNKLLNNNSNKKKPSKKIVRVRSVSNADKKIQKNDIKLNIHIKKPLCNSLELDYLNFTQMDIFNFDDSFNNNDGIFNPNYFQKNLNKNKIVSIRYENIDDISNSNNSSQIESNKNILVYTDTENNVKKENKEFLSNTPSTICNYYDKTSTKKKAEKNNNINIVNDTIKKNLIDVYDNDDNTQNKNKIKKNNTSINVNKNKTKNKIKNKSFSSNANYYQDLYLNMKTNNNSNKKIMKQNNNIPISKNNNDIPYSNNLMKNYLKNNISTKKKLSYGSRDNIKKNTHKKNISKEEINSKITISKNASASGYNISNNNNTTNVATINKKNSNEDTNSIIGVNNNTINNTNKKNIRKNSQQKPINLCFDKYIYESYFITPRNFNKSKKPNILSATKSTKLITTGSLAKTFSSNKISIKENYINKNIEESSNNKNYNLIKNIINKNKNNKNDGINNNIGFSISKKNILNDNNLNTDIKNNNINFIKVNLCSSTKSSSNLNIKKKRTSLTGQKMFIHNMNLNNNNLLNNENKKSINTLQAIYKMINKSGSGIKSPNKHSNLLKISKTLTEHNIINKFQVTPKNYKIPKYDAVPYTTLVKQMFACSNEKNSCIIKFDSSLKDKEQTKTEHLKKIFKPKTQSDFKIYKNIFANELNSKKKINTNCGNNNNIEYGIDKHVKQKLLDRMNKATSTNWHYLFRGNKSKKYAEENGIADNNKKTAPNIEDNLNYFYKNENIISDASEKEDEK